MLLIFAEGCDKISFSLFGAVGRQVATVREAFVKIQESGEMYLETILVLQKKKGAVRSLDVADSMGYSKPSVSRAVGLLKSSGHLLVDREGHLTLTEKGLAVAQKIYERHVLLTDFLVHLGVDEEIAAQDACKMEHVISETSFDAIKRHASTVIERQKASAE